MGSIEQTETFEDWYLSLDDIDRENVLAAILLLRERERPYITTSER